MNKCSIITYVSILALITNLNYSHAQVHDFDSLYTNDKSYRSAFESLEISSDVFSSSEVMNISIESDFKNLVKQKNKDEYQPATFRYYYNDTVTVTREITIKPRGNMRKGTCFFPPLKLNFKKKDVVIKAMKDFDKMKMVLDCKRGNAYEQYLLSEYYAYKILNLLTDYSFRVRLIHVTYIDKSEKYKTTTKYAFLIENKEQLAERHNAISIDDKNIRDQLIDATTLINTYLFQYLIGNTDWSIPGRHNIQMIKSNDPELTKPYVIPYDFDFAGIVNASYAVPSEALGNESVRERVYRGLCIPDSNVMEGVKYFISKKRAIYELYENSVYLDKNSKRSTLSYLDEFYAIIENDDSLKKYILEKCR